MQNRYAGDIGDFGKFQLLRYLFNHNKYILKQIWYLYPDETHNNDGMYINYFDKVKDQDLVLEEALKTIVQKKRDVQALEEANLLLNCTYYSNLVNETGKDSLFYRNNWLKKALLFSNKADFILVDPDNGIATKLIKDKDEKDIELLSFDFFEKKDKAGKYIFYDEIIKFYEVGRCLVVYHHLNRTMAHNKQIEKIKKKLEKDFFKVLAIKHKPYSPRVYFFILKDKYIHYYCLNKLKEFENKFTHHWQLFL